MAPPLGRHRNTDVDSGTLSRTRHRAPGPRGRPNTESDEVFFVRWAEEFLEEIYAALAAGLKAVMAPRQKLIDLQDGARENPDLQPRAGRTFCNMATYLIARGMGAPLGPLRDGKHIAMANQQAENLAAAKEYRAIDGDEAQQLANAGVLVIAVQPNPGGHGHICTVRPQNVPGDSPPPHGKGPLINNLGRHVEVDNENWAFLKMPPVHYYTPNKE